MITALNFSAWKEGVNVRFTVDLILTLAAVVLLSYIMIVYTNKDAEIDVDGTLMSILLTFVPVTNPEELNLIPFSGLFLAYSYCFFIGAYFLFAMLCRGILSSLYLIHTGYQSFQHVSISDIIVLCAVSVYTVFFFYIMVREP